MLHLLLRFWNVVFLPDVVLDLSLLDWGTLEAGLWLLLLPLIDYRMLSIRGHVQLGLHRHTVGEEPAFEQG